MKCVIYCRVSSERQSKEGHGLDSQEHRCREYAQTNGYEVEKVFRDSFTGGGDFMKRPAMSEMLAYLDKKAHTNYIVVFDDLKRFARDTIFHWKLRAELKVRRATPKCLNFNFEDTAEGEFIETIIAAQGQLERQQNRRKVIQMQRARLEKGYWSFFPPPGYKFITDKVHGRILVLDEPNASIAKEALEGFASGRFEEQVDVQEFLQRKRFCGAKRVYLEKVKRLLERSIYAGYIEYQDWEVERRRGHHEAIISPETYEKVIEKLNRKSGTHKRKDINEDFPLRGLVLCAGCRKPFTASWSNGRNKKHPYYRCATMGCMYGGKSVRRDDLENDFKVILAKIRPSQKILNTTKAIVLDIWQKKMGEIGDAIKGYTKKLNEVRAEVSSFVHRVGKAKEESIIETYEARIKELKKEEARLSVSVRNRSSPRVDFETALDKVFGSLKDPYSEWEKGGIHDQRLLFGLVFEEPLVYDKKNGFGTANLSLPLRVFELSELDNSQLVEVGGIEPPCKKKSRSGLQA